MAVDPEYQVPWREELVANFKVVGLVGRSSPPFALAILALTAVQGIAPAVIVLQTGVLLGSIPEAIKGGVQSAAAQASTRALVLLGLAILLSQVLGPIRGAVMFGLSHKFQSHLSRKLMSAVSRLPGIAYFEDPDFRDKLEITNWIGWAPVQSVQNVAGMFQQMIQFAALASVASIFAKWVPLVLFFGAVPAGIASWHFTSSIGLAQWRYSPEIRRAGYFKNLALEKEPAKEMRVSQLAGWTVGRQIEHWFNGMEEVWKLRHKSLAIALGLEVVAVVAVAFTFLSMVFAVLAGRFSIGAFSAASMAAVGTMSALVSVFQSASWIRRNNFWLPIALRLMKLADKDPRLDLRGSLGARSQKRTGIQFQDVSFSYQGSERKILDGLDLWIPSGSSVALVGENGAGKTTLIKLLCRFYDPDEGRILVDGVDIREFDLADLRTRLAVIFQDFVRYNLPAKHNVGFGAIAHIDDLKAIEESARRVGILDKIEGLDEGWETPLAREFGGADLSGGEWQRVALARAMMAQVAGDADILILDEPTASLDVRLEHELYEHFAELSRGRTTLLVSHRFSTVRMAERIVFLESGRVVEDGSHEELIQRQGRYSELYEIQASHYRLTGILE